MPKEVTMAFRVEENLRESFHESVLLDHRPASQVLRDFMRAYVEQSNSKQRGEPESPAKVAISPTERRRREQAVSFARASIGLEGLQASDALEASAAQFINGDSDLAAFVKGPREHARDK
ncbi:antitoxin VbhA family protein [Caballeronia sordidicola]|uniref:antitoxin VbhA family protein n=1 Tax=Caballeronia sordidicola TaxID=196367 RepID=UPI000A5F9D0A|nr:antitoxin VbhA family protein [Caballeronia sordidicola]